MTGTTPIDNTEDLIDSRAIIARIAYLDDEEELDDDERDELEALRALAEEAEGYCPDWPYGATLILDSYFEEYAEQFADDIGAIDRDASWPLSCIDWERAARELQMDYTSIDFGGVTYWVR
jgi:hypothetical protein